MITTNEKWQFALWLTGVTNASHVESLNSESSHNFRFLSFSHPDPNRLPTHDILMSLSQTVNLSVITIPLLFPPARWWRMYSGRFWNLAMNQSTNSHCITNQSTAAERTQIIFFQRTHPLNSSYNTRITIPMTIFIVLSSWRGHCESSPGSFDKCRLSARWPPTLRPSQSTWPRSLLLSTSTITIYYYYWVWKAYCVWKADTHFTMSRRVESWVELGYPTSRIAVITWRM